MKTALILFIEIFFLNCDINCRNPLYVATVLIQAGLAFAFNTPYLLVTGIPFWTYLHFVVIPKEESVLTKLFGKEYTTYLSSVPKWLFL